MNKKFSVTLVIIFCALLARGQEAPPATSWESDPLDVLEEQQQQEIQVPTLPEFAEVPEEGFDVPPPQSVESTPMPVPAETFRQETPTPVTTPATSFGSSEPDFSKEAEFHRIYKTYNQAPTAEESWEKAVGARQAEVYKVQSGDTLWGISTTFFADSQFWPKIWSLNKASILNPHEIDPAMNIQFFAGSLEDVPTVQLAANTATDEMVAASAGTEGVTSVPAPRAKKYTPVLKNLPRSLPSSRIGLGPAPSQAVEIDLPKTVFPTAPEALGYYLSDVKVDGVGHIVGTEANVKTAGDFQYIFVNIEGTTSKDYVVQKNVGQVKDPAVKERHGQMVEIQGQIQILDRVNDQQNVYRAMVTKTIQPIEVGSVLIPGRLPMIDPTPSSVTTGVGARIIGGQFDKKRTLFGTNSLIFLDAGAGQGLQVGQSLNVYSDNRVRNKKSVAVINDRVIGTVKIVNTSGNFATAYVTRVLEDVLVGDYVGRSLTQSGRAMAPSAPNSSSDLDFDDEFESAPSDAPAPEGGSDDFDFDL